MNFGSGRLAIFGAGGHGRVVADCALSGGWVDAAFFDDHLAPGSAVGPWSVVGGLEELIARADSLDGFVVAIGNNEARWATYKLLAGRGASRPVTIVHPASSVSRYADIGPGGVVVAGAVINIGARIGAAAIINTGASVDHDVDLGDGVHVSPGARLAGGVKVGHFSWIGAGAVVREGIEIGSHAVVGAGSVVVRPVPDGATVVGNPARLIVRSRS